MNSAARIISIVIRLAASLVLPVWGAVVLALGVNGVSPWWIVTGLAVLIVAAVILAGSPLLGWALYDSD